MEDFTRSRGKLVGILGIRYVISSSHVVAGLRRFPLSRRGKVQSLGGKAGIRKETMEADEAYG